MTEDSEASVLTARRAPQHVRLSSAADAYDTIKPRPSPPYAGRCIIASRFRCHSCECGYIVRGLRTVCCLPAPTSQATCDGAHGLTDFPLQAIIPAAFRSHSE